MLAFEARRIRTGKGSMAAIGTVCSIRLFLVEDQFFTAAGILKSLEQDPHLAVLRHFTSAEEALEQEAWVGADIALLDLGLPGMNGMELTRELLLRKPALKVIWLTAYPVVELSETAKSFGATAVLYKTCLPGELLEMIFTVYSGKKNLVQQCSRLPTAPWLQDERISQLSARQRQILSLIAQGFMTKEIADRLDLSPRTVESHRVAIMRRLNSENVADVTRIACRNGLAPL
jgi:DNA-binding NarL/FixJ family response regulator